MQKEEKKREKDGETKRQEPIIFHLEADRVMCGISVSVSGVMNVIDFTKDTVLLKLRRGKLKISGCGLSISVYENRIVEIFGKVERIEFV